jgi:hypothetical protein
MTYLSNRSCQLQAGLAISWVCIVERLHIGTALGTMVLTGAEALTCGGGGRAQDVVLVRPFFVSECCGGNRLYRVAIALEDVATISIIVVPVATVSHGPINLDHSSTIFVSN